MIPVLGSQPAGDMSQNSAVGCHYFPPGPQLPSQPLRGLLPILLLGEQRHNGCEQFDKTVTRQRRDYDLNPGHSVPESSTLTTRPPSHHKMTAKPKPNAHETKSRGDVRTTTTLAVQVARPHTLPARHE